MVFLLPGMTIRSGFFSSFVRVIYRTATPGTRSSGAKSVKLEMRGKRMTAISSNAACCPACSRSDRLSSSSISRCRYGTTPTNGICSRCSIISSPGFKIFTSPRNLLTISPLMRACSSGCNKATVPYNEANTPPRSMSPTSKTGASTSSASPILTMSFSRRLISAGEPAPSMTRISYSAARLLYASRMSGISCFL